MPVTSEGRETEQVEPAAPAPSRFWSIVSMVRLALALVATATLLPYAWGYTLVVYSQWQQLDPHYVMQLVAGIVAVVALNFHLATKFPRRMGPWVLEAVLAIWTIDATLLIVLSNGSKLADWLVLSVFLPATLWVPWVAWMFFMKISWLRRMAVLAVLVLGVAPFLKFMKVDGLTGDARANFALRSSEAEDDVKSTAGELSADHRLHIVAAGKDDFTGFQGSERSAVLPDVRLDGDWKTHPPREVWRRRVGQGWGGFAVVGRYAFTQEQRGSEECVVCRDMATGDELWTHKDAAPYMDKPRYEGMGGPGPRCTPTVDGERVVTMGATGLLNCLDGGTGHPIWRVDVVQDTGGSIAFHGVCGSPLVVGDAVIVSPTGAPGKSLAAYDRATGKRQWATGEGTAGYTSPMMTTLAGTPQILNFTSASILAHDPKSGEVLWRHAWSNSEHVICSQPIAHAGADDQVLLTVGYGGGSILLKVGRDPAGKWSTTPVWPSPSRNMKTKFSTAVVHGDYVYGLDEGILQCVDLKTGRQKWKGGRYQFGQVLLAGDLILVQTEPGPVALVETNPDRFVELGRIPALSDKTWNCPTLAGKYLLVRNAVEAACYELALRASPGLASTK